MRKASKRTQRTPLPWSRPGAVCVFDLVKHSSRPRTSIEPIQQVLHDVLSRAEATLSLTEITFKYTGDGYLCTLLGDSSARLIDFLNCVLPDLTLRLGAHSQEFRVGFDFGILRETHNRVTRANEHFDLPGVLASRLQSVARPNQALCTETVYHIFRAHYPDAFNPEPLRLWATDREILAYEFIPSDASELPRLIAEYVGLSEVFPALRVPTRTKILIVDDEPMVLEALLDMFNTDYFKDLYAGYTIVSARNGQEALALFRPGEFALVLTDIIMPGLSGDELTRRITHYDPDQVVIAITAISDIATRESFFSVGGFFFLDKPLFYHPFRHLRQFLGLPEAHRLSERRLRTLCREPARLFRMIQDLRETLELVLELAQDRHDVVHRLVRHKAKQLIYDFLDRTRPGNDIIALATQANVQMQSILRLIEPAAAACSDIDMIIFPRRHGVPQMSLPECESHLTGLIADLGKAHPGVHFSLECVLPETWHTAQMSFGRALIFIVCELLDNAISAIKGKGSIKARLEWLRSLGLLRVEVLDSGAGVPSRLMRKIFDAGVSTKGSGRGLGLSLLRDTATALGGNITYATRNGALFTVTLPVSPATPTLVNPQSRRD